MRQSALRFISPHFSAQCVGATAPVGLFLRAHAAHLLHCSILNFRNLASSFF